MPEPFNHEYWMAQAIQLAHNGFYSTHPNPRVGCVVVKNSKLVAQGWHEFSGGPHAEINAIGNNQIPSGCDFYVTLEPCSHQGKTAACVDALIKRKPGRVIIAMQDPNPLVAGAGLAKLEAAGIEVINGVLETEARLLNPGFVSRLEKGRPFVRLKMATSLDGRTALKNGESKWITDKSARLDVQRLRARSSAVLTSAKTVKDDNPSLNLRLSKSDLGQNIEVRQPIRVIIDTKLQLTGKEKVFQSNGEIWIYTLSNSPIDIERLVAAGAHVSVLDDSCSGKINLAELMSHLAKREINEVHTECGQTLAGALIQQHLVDEIIIYMAPKLLGSRSMGAFDLGQLTHMSDSVNCNIEQLRMIGEDIRLTLSLKSNEPARSAR
jgi:diaminohydroxyphosphoribosylaminopyrimidine deaminase/5-amino-6-(5-phosphoribosylamino)uracil reductase